MTLKEMKELETLIHYHTQIGFTQHCVVAPFDRPELVGKEVKLGDKWYPVEYETSTTFKVRSW